MIYVLLPQRTAFQKMITGCLCFTSFIFCLNKREIAKNWFYTSGEGEDQHLRWEGYLVGYEAKEKHLFWVFFKALVKNSG